MSERGKPDNKKRKGKGRRESRPESAMLGGYRNAMQKGARVKTNERHSTNN